MTIIQAAHNCRWAHPTLFVPAPYWLEAWDCPWSCQAEDGPPRVLVTTELCLECARWELRAGHRRRDA